MDLLQNPFHILGATPRDNRQKITELAEEYSLLLDHGEEIQARTNLTHPRKRLSAEISWMLGVSQTRASEIIGLLESSAMELFGRDELGPVDPANFWFRFHSAVAELTALMPIAQANLLAAGLSRLPDYSVDDVVKWFIEIAQAFEGINSEEVCTTINDERSIAGFPQITDLSVIDAEIKKLRQHYRQVITSALRNLSDQERARTLTSVVGAATDDGERPGLVLIYDVVASYEVDVHESLEQVARKIESLTEELRVAADMKSLDATLAPIVDELTQTLKNWDTLAQPIQVSTKSQGKRHDASHRVAGCVRKLAVVDLWNAYGKLEFAQQLIGVLREVFAEVPDIAAYLDADARKLDEIASELERLEADRLWLQEQAGYIESLVEQLRVAAYTGNPDSTLAPMVDQLTQTLKNWDSLTQSFPAGGKNQGLLHEFAYQIVGGVRELALHLCNKHDKLNFSLQLINTLREVLATDDNLASLLSADARELGEIIARREKWRKEITYEADIGINNFSKNKLRISPDGVEWKGERWDLNSITRIRWSGIRYSVHDVPTGTIHTVVWGNDTRSASIELTEDLVYTNFIDRLWKTVGIRLLAEYLQSLRDGQKHRFGSAVISDYGVELERKRLFFANERVFCRWSELAIWNGPGVFYIGKKADRKVTASFSYEYDDNIHVVEAAIRLFLDRGGDRLSDLLDVQQ